MKNLKDMLNEGLLNRQPEEYKHAEVTKEELLKTKNFLLRVDHVKPINGEPFDMYRTDTISKEANKYGLFIKLDWDNKTVRLTWGACSNWDKTGYYAEFTSLLKEASDFCKKVAEITSYKCML